jgi:thioredoxin 1
MEGGSTLKKVIIFLAIVLALFAAIFFINKYQQNEKAKNNPYGKTDLHPETIDQLHDPNYQNLILPNELKKKLDQKESLVVYFYSPTCPHCKKTTPILMPLAKSMNVHVYQYNLLEFDQGWDDYHIQFTPTIVYYEKGKEKARLVGEQPKEKLRSFLEQTIKK